MNGLVTSTIALADPHADEVWDLFPVALPVIEPAPIPVEPMPVLVTAEQAADVLGVSTRTLSRWEKVGRLPPIRVGRAVFYRGEDIDRAVKTEIKTRALGANRTRISNSVEALISDDAEASNRLNHNHKGHYRD